jgi:hypothetical protein
MKSGTSKYDVLKYCGKPDSITNLGTKTYKGKYSESEVSKEEWYYIGLIRGKDCVFIINGTHLSAATKLD